jgi:YesN/AraC family two-component response regulator
VSHICHAGLLDTVVPILKNKILCGYIIIGRVRPDTDFDGIYEKLKWLNTNEKELEEKYMQMPYMNESKRESLINLISTIVFDKAIEIDYDDFISKATNYIDENLSSTLSIEDLCANLFVSKNFLYKSFRSFYSCTVNEYITSRRIEKAKELLRGTGESVHRISEEIGFNNYTYFSRLFKNATGISPNKYRKN